MRTLLWLMFSVYTVSVSAQPSLNERRAAEQLCQITGWCLPAVENLHNHTFTFVGPRGLSFSTKAPSELLRDVAVNGRVKMIPGGIVFPDFEMHTAEVLAGALGLNVLCVEDLFGVACEFTGPNSGNPFWTVNNIKELDDLVAREGAAEVSARWLGPVAFAAADELARRTGWTRTPALFSRDRFVFRYLDTAGNLFATDDPGPVALRITPTKTPLITPTGGLRWVSSCAHGLKPVQ